MIYTHMKNLLGYKEYILSEHVVLNEKKEIDSSRIERALKKKSEKTGVSMSALRTVMRRGMAAWKTGHRPGAGQEQWGYARVNSFLTGGKGTWGSPKKDPKGGADSDVAKKVAKSKRAKEKLKFLK
jgi:hypothetical protein